MKLGCIFGKLPNGKHVEIAGVDVPIHEQKRIYDQIILAGGRLEQRNKAISLVEVIAFDTVARHKRFDIPHE